ncbi:MAG: transglutaminase-like cysteine peptidase [Hyphomicrobiales bacterium]
MNKLVVTLLMTIAGAATAGGAHAERAVRTEGQKAGSAAMQTFGRTLPPIGHVSLCERLPGECKPMKAGIADAGPVSMTAERQADLWAVNDLVNRIVRPVTDMELYGKVEHWTYPAGAGDCEDYVLLKRRLLMERGWPAGALLITVVRDEFNEGHAILTARTSDGDYVLDNKKSEILAWNQTAYTFVKRQSESDPSQWVSLTTPSRWALIRSVSTQSTDSDTEQDDE